jgi:hypothetical protein
VKSRFAGAAPSVGAVQMAWSRTNATTSLRGDSSGSSPSLMRTGVPPAKGIVHSSTFGATGDESGFGDGPSQLEP